MHINLSEEFAKFINDNIESGFYNNSSEVIREALRRMRREQVQENYYLKYELSKGLVQVENGEVEEYDLDQIKEEALKKLKKKNFSIKESVKP